MKSERVLFSPSANSCNFTIIVSSSKFNKVMKQIVLFAPILLLLNIQVIFGQEVSRPFPNVDMPSINGSIENTYNLFAKRDYTIIMTGYICGPDVRQIIQLRDSFPTLKKKYNINLVYIYTSYKDKTTVTNLEADKNKVKKVLIEQSSISAPREWEYLFDVVDRSIPVAERASQYLGKFNDGTCPSFYIVDKNGLILNPANSGLNYVDIQKILQDNHKKIQGNK